jgi:hypothetical protein
LNENLRQTVSAVFRCFLRTGFSYVCSKTSIRMQFYRKSFLPQRSQSTQGFQISPTLCVLCGKIFIPRAVYFCELDMRRSNPRRVVIARSAATKQSGKSCISGLLRRCAPRNDDGAENSFLQKNSQFSPV